ncbi:MAG: MATE family efflux transporter [Bacteroidaceae bacterium]|nr:MATE family efflux transporter [Bacteroidaceae bacterium]
MSQTTQKDLLLQKIRDGLHLTGRDQLRLAATLSIPSMLAQLSAILMEYIDAAMVGSLGAEASASIGIVSTTIWLFAGVCSAFSKGFYVQVAHRIGGNELAQARNVLRQGLSACLQFSVLLTIIGVAISPYLPTWLGGAENIRHDASIYFMVFCLCIPLMQMNSLCSGMLRCAGDTRTPSTINILMCVLDVLFNWLLIFPSHTILGLHIPGAGLGVLGAVLGTAISFAFGALMMMYFVCIRSRELNLLQDSGRFRPTLDTLRRSFKISLPMGLEHIIMCSAQIMSTIIIAPLGTVALAANSFGITIEALCYMPGYGISDASTALVGQSLGAHRRHLARSFGRITLTMGILIMTLMGVVMYFYSPALMTLMTPDTAVQLQAVKCLRIEAFAEPMFAANIVAYGIFVGAGDTLVPCSINLGCIWAVRIPLAALLVGTMGLQGAWVAMAIDLSLRGAIFLWRFRGKHWMRKIV